MFNRYVCPILNRIVEFLKIDKNWIISAWTKSSSLYCSMWNSDHWKDTPHCSWRKMAFRLRALRRHRKSVIIGGFQNRSRNFYHQKSSDFWNLKVLFPPLKWGASFRWPSDPSSAWNIIKPTSYLKFGPKLFNFWIFQNSFFSCSIITPCLGYVSCIGLWWYSWPVLWFTRIISERRRSAWYKLYFYGRFW